MSNEDSSKLGNPSPSRHLAWPQCYNTRDLGGLPARDGKVTRWRSVIRSDMLNRLTETGQQALLDYGVKTIIDLRSPQEAEKEPSITLINPDLPLDYMNLPLEKYYPHVGALIRQAISRAEVYCIILDHYPDSVAEVMRAIARAQPGGIIVHCQSGTDRTGIVSALLLKLIGVHPNIIAADYAKSQVRLWPLYEKIMAETKDKSEVDFWQRPTATADMMVTLLEHIDTRHGGVENYLHASGLSSNEIDLLKNRMLGA